MKFNYAPAFCFPKAKKNELNKTDQLITPSPDKYNPKKMLHKDPEWKIGTSLRPKESNLDYPGPGTYNTRFKFPDGPAYSIANRKNNVINEDQITPGPASYNPKKLGEKSSYTFGHKYKNKENEATPGPGNYDIRKEKDLKVPSSIFGHEKKFFSSKEGAFGPGPGQYNGDIATTNIHHPKYSFGKEKRVTDKINEYPGPGAYKHQIYTGKEGKRISMGLKYKCKSTESLPGPGQYCSYNYNLVSNKLPDIKIGKAKRFITDNAMAENPGPGQYENNIKYVKLQKPSWKIGTSLRKPLNEVTDTPGPGKYDLSMEIGIGKPMYSMRIKEKDKGNRYVTPGPGRYNNAEMNLYKHYPEWKIGTSKRDDALERQIREGFPGPGNYQYNENHMTSKPKYGFGTQKRYKDKFNDNPGPGTYHIPCSIVEVNEYTRRQGSFDDKYKKI